MKPMNLKYCFYSIFEPNQRYFISLEKNVHIFYYLWEKVNQNDLQLLVFMSQSIARQMLVECSSNARRMPVKC